MVWRSPDAICDEMHQGDNAVVFKAFQAGKPVDMRTMIPSQLRGGAYYGQKVASREDCDAYVASKLRKLERAKRTGKPMGEGERRRARKGSRADKRTHHAAGKSAGSNHDGGGVAPVLSCMETSLSSYGTHRLAARAATVVCPRLGTMPPSDGDGAALRYVDGWAVTAARMKGACVPGGTDPLHFPAAHFVELSLLLLRPPESKSIDEKKACEQAGWIGQGSEGE